MSITYPGVYVQEILGQTQPIGGVTTSLTAFLGRAPTGPVATPTLCNNLSDVHNLFGADWTGLPMGQSLSDFFVNGGGQALVIRLVAAASGQDNPPLSAQDLTDGLAALDPASSFNLL
eukprot:gene25417-25562_t